MNLYVGFRRTVVGFHLKDKELEEKLNELSDGEFLKNLYEDEDGHFVSHFGPRFTSVRSTKTEEITRFLVRFWGGEVEWIPEYDPDDWNDYPDVTPPEGVVMRIELRNGLKFGAYFRHLEDGDYWCYPDGKIMPKAYSDDVVHFRPWE